MSLETSPERLNLLLDISIEVIVGEQSLALVRLRLRCNVLLELVELSLIRSLDSLLLNLFLLQKALHLAFLIGCGSVLHVQHNWRV